MSQKNVLSRKFVRQLEDLVLEHKVQIESGKWTQEQFAVMASRKLGLTVSMCNVRSCGKAMEVNFKTSTGKAGGFARSVKELRVCVILLAKELVSLKGELGQVASPTLHSLAQGSTEDES